MEASPMDLKLLERTMPPESRARKERDALASFVERKPWDAQHETAAP